MAHPRSFDSDAVLAVLMEQFWEHGFQGASTRDLVDATRVRKASLYAAFGDKQAMYRTALVHYIDEEVGAADAMLMTAGGQSAIAALFDGVIEEVDEAVPEPIDIEQDRRDDMYPELVPRQRFGQLFQRAVAARQSHHRVGQLIHQRLALVH